MGLLRDLLTDLPDGDVVEVRIGLHWTAVVIEVEGKQRCGLSSTLESPHEHGGEPQVPQAGLLKTLAGRELAALALDNQPTLASVGVASLNALLPLPETFSEINAEHVLANYGADKRVAIVGHFPFIPRLRSASQNSSCSNMIHGKATCLRKLLHRFYPDPMSSLSREWRWLTTHLKDS